MPPMLAVAGTPRAEIHTLHATAVYAGSVYASIVYVTAVNATDAHHAIIAVAGTPLTVAGKEDSEIHHTIAELMILANSAVAEKIEGAFPSSALVRTHTAPDPSRLTTFQDVAEKAGVTHGKNSELDKGGGKGSTFGRFYCFFKVGVGGICLLYTSPSPRDKRQSRMPSSA